MGVSMQRLREIFAEDQFSKLSPVLRIDESFGMVELIEVFRSGEEFSANFLADAIFSHDEGCWYDDSGPGLGEFIDREATLSTVDIDVLHKAFSSKLSPFISLPGGILDKGKVDQVLQVANDWNRKVFCIVTEDNKGIACCYSCSD